MQIKTVSKNPVDIRREVVIVTTMTRIQFWEEIERLLRKTKLTHAKAAVALGVKLETFRGWKYRQFAPRGPALVEMERRVAKIMAPLDKKAKDAPEPKPED